MISQRVAFIKKNSKEVHPHYVVQCQYRQLEKHKQWLKLREVIKKPNYYKNHFSLTEEKRELLETALDVII